MKAAVLTGDGIEVRDVEKPKPRTQPGLGAGAGGRTQPGRPPHGVRPYARQCGRTGIRTGT